MIQLQQKWLENVPWETVVQDNEALCRERKLTLGPKSQSFDDVRKEWEAGMSREMGLKEVLDLCCRCREQRPFAHYNGETFSAIARKLVEDWAHSLPPVEGQIVRTTVGHYVTGSVGKNELLQVIRSFGKQWQPITPKPAPQRAPATVQPEPQTT